MCESYSKKTISAEHLEAAMKEFDITEHLGELRYLEDSLKEQNQLKREASQRMEEMLAKDLEEQRAKRKEEEIQKKEVTLREKFEEIDKAVDNKDDDIDYENIVDVDAEEEDEA